MRKRVAYHLGGHRSNRFHILVQQGLLHLVDQVDDAFVLRIGCLASLAADSTASGNGDDRLDVAGPEDAVTKAAA